MDDILSSEENNSVISQDDTDIVTNNDLSKSFILDYDNINSIFRRNPKIPHVNSVTDNSCKINDFPITNAVQLDPVNSITSNFNMLIYKENFTEHHRSLDNESKGEKSSRAIFEELFYPYKFYSVRLDMLANPYTGWPLEIDGLCAIPIFQNDIMIGYIYVGFEFNGRQHYEYVKYFHKLEQEFEKQVMRDLWKKSKCERLGFVLISIRYDVNNIRSYIIESLNDYPQLCGLYKV